MFVTFAFLLDEVGGTLGAHDPEERIASFREIEVAELPALDLQHLRRLTDGTGLIQHACFLVPDYTEGYCTDDNARGLLVAVKLEESGQALEASRELGSRYLAFLRFAFNRETGRFRNFLSFDRRWCEENLPDWLGYGRA